MNYNKKLAQKIIAKLKRTRPKVEGNGYIFSTKLGNIELNTCTLFVSVLYKDKEITRIYNKKDKNEIIDLMRSRYNRVEAKLNEAELEKAKKEVLSII